MHAAIGRAGTAGMSGASHDSGTGGELVAAIGSADTGAGVGRAAEEGRPLNVALGRHADSSRGQAATSTETQNQTNFGGAENS